MGKSSSKPRVDNRISVTPTPMPTPRRECCICDRENGIRMKCWHYICSECIIDNAWHQAKSKKYEISCAQCTRIIDLDDLIRLGIPDGPTKKALTEAISLNYCKSLDKDIQQCPSCTTYCQRQNTEQNLMKCLVCSKENKPFEFCWICCRVWNNPGNSQKCGNVKCGEISLEHLKNPPMTDFDVSSKRMLAPKYRACPRCFTFIEHASGCNEMTCRGRKRLERCIQLKVGFAPGTEDQILFSDEKLFTVEEASNRQNDRILASRSQDIPDSIKYIDRVQKPLSLMVWAGVSADSRTNLIFVPQGVKINSQTYRELVFEPEIASAGEKLFQNHPWTYQQDSAPAHASKVSQSWFHEQNIDFIMTRDATTHPIKTTTTTTTTNSVNSLSLLFSSLLSSTNTSRTANPNESLPSTQELFSRVLREVTPSLSPPQRAEFDDLAAQVSELSLSHAEVTAGIKRDVEEIKLDMAVMRSAIEALGKNERDKEELQTTIARLESAVIQLRDENEQLLEQQSRDVTAQVASSTQSLPSFVSPIRSSTPKMGVSRGDPDESYHIIREASWRNQRSKEM
ncbi:hypothetical protein LOD99_8985 [Oopsacas minuta]|uniref:RING-type domain-containing protein n=1 Tax=Oopsacas minuta TaxID=111878 RepID=A0AAV7JE41_9METZ|nr:hypothetical protein LOD99_8985 [Oopsacas minuta]